MLSVVISAAAIVLIIFPVFSFAMEKYVMLNIGQTIKDSVDITNLAVYSSIKHENLSKACVSFDNTGAYATYTRLLAENLSLNEDMMPAEGSLADGRVVIDSLVLYEEDFPQTCPNGLKISRPAIHSCITVPVRPVLYRDIILQCLGKEHIELKVHVDTDIPLDR